MSKENNYFKIGLTTIVAFFLLIAAIVAFGLGNAFKTKVNCETFFDQTIQGLTTGSSVKFRGFNVGQVTDIGLSNIKGESGKQLVKVNFYIEPKSLLGSSNYSTEEVEKFIIEESAKGLKVSLNFQGVTGASFLDLDYRSSNSNHNIDKDIAKMNPESKLLYIPNTPSTVTEIGESLSLIVKSLERVNFGGLSDSLLSLVGRLDNLVAEIQEISLEEDTKKTLISVTQAANEFTSFAKLLQGDVSTIEIDKLGKNLNNTINQLNISLKRLDQILISPQSNLPGTLENFKAISENIRELSETLKRDPSLAIFGRPPKEIKKVDQSK